MDVLRLYHQRALNIWFRLKRKCYKHKTASMLFLFTFLFVPWPELFMFPFKLLFKEDCPKQTGRPRDEGEVNFLEFQVVDGAPLRRLCVVDGDQFPRKPDDQRIFFHETTGSDCLTYQQVCAVEAAAQSNPERSVQVYMMTSELNETCPAFRVLSFYPNVEIVLIDGDSYFEESPLGQWYFGRRWEESEDPSGHVGHMMRLLSLWKAGGVALHFDQWLVADLDEPWWSDTNFIVQDFSNRPLIDQVASFESKHPLVEKFMKAANATYRRKGWARERSTAYRRLVLEFCRRARMVDEDDRCPGLKVLGPGEFYPDLSASRDEPSWEHEPKNRTVASLDGSTLKKNETLRTALARDVCPHSYFMDKNHL